MPRVTPAPVKYSQRQVIQHSTSSLAHMSWAQLAVAAFNWSLWLFIMFLMLSQLLTAINNSTFTKLQIQLGQDISRGLYRIPGENDEPYSDRVIACVRRGHTFKAVSLSDALYYGRTIVEDTSGAAIHGYRVVHRTGLVFSDSARQKWTQTCRLMNATLNGIFQACEDLGYTNLTRDSLRVMDGNTLWNIPDALPVLIMPIWDNALTSRSAIPAWNGHACMFRLRGQFDDSTDPQIYLTGVNRVPRETRTVEWLGRPEGVWKNGWYQDLDGVSWYSDIPTAEITNSSGLAPRYFDPSIGKEMLCRIGFDCPMNVLAFSWSAELATVNYFTTQTVIIVSNGARFGLSYVHANIIKRVTCVFELTALISNASIIMLLGRWMIAMLALYRGYSKRISRWHSAGLGSIAHAPSFIYLPIAMMPRMKVILAAFYTISCDFEGSQQALTDAWFVMYPCIVDLVLIYASLLNTVTKVFRRRMSDWGFPFAVVALSVMHYNRHLISSIALLNPFQGRMSTQISDDEYEGLTVVDMLSADVALRMDGNAPAVLWLKLLIVALSIFPLLLSENMGLRSKRSRAHRSCRAERALKIRACNVGGIGQHNRRLKGNVLTAYELVRLGYLVVGDRYLMTIEDWLVLITTSYFKSTYTLWNYRIMAFHVTEVRKGTNDKPEFQLSVHGELRSIHDPVLTGIAWWNIDARPLI